MIKLLCKPSTDIQHRKMLAAKLHMFECWMGNELVLLPESKADEMTKRNNVVIRSLF